MNAPKTSIGKLTAKVGEFVEVPITVLEDCELGAITLSVTYKTDELEFVNWIKTDYLPSALVNIVPTPNTPTEKTIMFAWYSVTGYDVHVKSGTKLLLAKFKYLGGTGTLRFVYSNDGDFRICEYGGGIPAVAYDNLPDTYIDGYVVVDSASKVIVNALPPLPNAPITTLPIIKSAQPKTKKGLSIKGACKIKNFNNIQAITLVFTFNPKIVSIVKLEFNKNMPDQPLYNTVPVSEKVSQLRIAWSSLTPFTLKNNQTLFDMFLKYSGGETDLMWQTELDGGGMCEYAIFDKVRGPVALPDTPSADFYKNGKVCPK